MRSLRLLSALAAVLALPACDSAPPPPGDALAPNTFTVRVGDAPEQTRAEAHFGTYVSEASGNTFAVVLGARPISAPLSLAAPAVGFAYDGVAVSTGTYPLEAVNPDGEPPKEAFIGVYIDPAQTTGGTPGRAGFYYSGEGAVTLDSLLADRARGTFSMTAVELDADSQPTGAEVAVTGAFHAVRTDVFGDEDAFWRAAGAPKRGIGPVSRGRLTGFVREANEGVRFGDRTSLVDAVSSERVRALFQGRTRKGLEEFSALLADLGAERADEALPLVESVLARLRPSGWLDALDSRVDGGRREEALEALVQLARDHDEEREGSGAAGFVARLTLDGGPNEAAGEGGAVDGAGSPAAAVRLSTLHGAKGAEFDVVAIVGVAEESIPHGRTLSERPDTGVDEERRLLFVGLTRARDQVFLTWPKRRRCGGEGWAPARASRFFSDLPTDLVGRVPPELVDSLATQGGPETLGLNVGDRVEHPHFGEGEVVLFTSRDADARAIVVFEGLGPRELFLRHTTLRRVPR